MFTLKENHINRIDAVQLHSWSEYKVPKWGYSIAEEELDPEKTVKASGREIRVSHKSAHEICRTIKGMTLTQAKQFLRDVIAKKRAVPFKRFKKKSGTPPRNRKGLRRQIPGKSRKTHTKNP